MAKIVIMHDTDPGIGITLELFRLPNQHWAALGWKGACTECGWVVHKWREEKAIEIAKRHVDSHPAVLAGGDTDSLVR